MTEGRGVSQSITQTMKGKGHSPALPASLKTPINITFDQLMATKAIDNGLQECDLSDHLRNEWLALHRDIQQRILDAAVLCGFNLQFFFWHFQLDMRPFLHLFACKFPRAFRFQLDGTPAKPRKNGGWNLQRKLELVNFVEQAKRAGLTETEACDWYAFLRGNQPVVSSLITRYHEAKRWLSDIDRWTSYERFEALEYFYGGGTLE